MSLTPRDLRALALLVIGVLAIVVYRSMSGGAPEVVSGTESPALLEMRLAKLRQIAATVPAKTAALQTAREQLKAREKHIMAFATAPQAQAHLLELIHRVASANKIEPRGGDFAPPALLGSDYGQVAVSVLFECKIEDFVNFLADLSKEPELVAPSDVRIAAGNLKNKTINVHMTLAGAVPRKLVPEKRALGVL